MSHWTRPWYDVEVEGRPTWTISADSVADARALVAARGITEYVLRHWWSREEIR